MKNESTVEYDEAGLSHSIVQSLTDSEKEIAARVSYKYYLAATTPSSQKPSEAEREDLAMELAKRFLFVVNGNIDLATTNMKSTLKYRHEVLQIDDIRKSFLQSDDAALVDEEENTNERFTAIRLGLGQQIENTNTFIRGYDNGRRPILRSLSASHSKWDERYHCMLHEVMMDRALAANERNGGKYSKISIIFDFSGYTMKNKTPIPRAKQLIFTLRDHYPEFVEHVFIMDAPLIFRFFWLIIQPFIDPITKRKIKFVRTTDQENSTFSKYVSDDNTKSFGRGKTGKNFDLKKYLTDTPYDRDIDGN